MTVEGAPFAVTPISLQIKDVVVQAAESRGFLPEPLVLHGRALLLVRNVGHLMTNEAVLLKGEEVPEGILDAVITATIGAWDSRLPVFPPTDPPRFWS